MTQVKLESALRLCAFALKFRSMAVTIRAAAIHWLVSKFGDTGNTICTSKFYIPEKSWTGRSAWWVEIPRRAIETPKSDMIDLVCEVAPGVDDFYYLKVPVKFLKAELPKICVLNSGKLSLFLSAERNELFVEQRGKGKIGFGRFLKPSNLAA